MRVESRGTVRARTRSRLASEVAGRVVEVAEAFSDGGFFRKGDLLVRIDASDYELAVRRLEAQLGQATAALAALEVEVTSTDRQITLAAERHELHKKHLARMGKLTTGGISSDSALESIQRDEIAARDRLVELRSKRDVLVARRAGLDRAVALAKVDLEKARLDQTRTRILAPYDGRVLERTIDLGQFVSRGSELARIYAVDVALVRLPLTDRQRGQVELPIRYRGEDQSARQPHVTLTVTQGSQLFRWPGKIVRTDGAVDAASRQLFAIAQIEDPYGHHEDDRPPLRIGTYVTARIDGRKLRGVYVVPRAVLQSGEELLMMDGPDRVRRQPVEIVWRSTDSVVIAGGTLPDPLEICATPLVFAGDSVAVQTRSGPPPGKGKSQNGSKP